MKSTHQAVKVCSAPILKAEIPPDFWSESSWFRAIAQQSPDLIGAVSLAGEWLCLNPRGQALLGGSEFQLDEARQQLWDQTILPRLYEEGQWRGEFALVGASGLVWVESQWFLIRDRDSNQPVGFATMSREIQSPMIAEVLEQKNRFLADTAHELRSPLSVISTSLDLLQAATVEESDRQRKHFQRIRSKIKQMAQMLDNLLTLSRTEQTEFAVTPDVVNPVQVCAELVEEAQASTAQHEIVFSPEASVQVAKLDAILFEKIVTNLLSNSIKYSPQGGRIHCHLQIDSDHLTLQVADQGIGIPNSEQPQLFQSFYRARNVNVIPGTGLGLAIVKRCVDLLGGEIDLKSAIGVGTCFTVQVPISAF